MQHTNRHLFSRELFKRADDRLQRTLDIRLDDDWQLLRDAGGDLRKHLLERATRSRRRICVAPPTLTKIGDIASAALVLCDHEIVARKWRSVEAEHLDRRRRPRLSLALASIIDESTYATPFAAGDKDVAGPQRAALNEHGCDRPASSLQLRLQNDALCGAVRIGHKIEQFGLQQDGFFKLVKVGLLQRGNFDIEHLAAELLDHDFVLQQFLSDPLGS